MAFPDAVISHLPRAHSDHCLIMLSTCSVTGARKCVNSFFFQSAWFLHGSFPQWFQDNWDRNQVSMVEKTKIFTDKVRVWSSTVFGDLNRKKKRLWARTAGVQRSLMQAHSNGLLKLERKLQLELDEVLKQEEVMCFQKSRCDWISSGDRNTKYFHRAVTIKGQKKMVTCLLDGNANWVSDPLEVQNLVVNYYDNLYHDDGRNMNFVLDNRFLALPYYASDIFEKPICMEDVHGALFDMEPSKAPGLDGYPA